MKNTEAIRKVAAFYDRSLRLWTAFLVDENGHQDADAGYGITKADAVADARREPRYDDIAYRAGDKR